VTLWRRLAARDALSSRVALRLMRALAAAGDAGAAVQHARVHEMLLREELNIPPDPAVVSLVRQLQAVRVDEHPSPREPNVPKVESSAPPPLKVDRSPSRSRSWRRPAAMLAAGLACVLVFGPTAGPVGRESDLSKLLARGHSAEQSRSPTGVETAKRHYKRAIEVDPDFAPAYAALSRIYALTALFGYAPAAPALDSARMMAVSAVARDGDLPEAHTALAMSLGDAGDFDGAEREFRHAFRLDQDNADAHYWYSILLLALGRAHDARSEVELALKLDRLLPLRGVKMVQRNSAYVETGKRPAAQWDSINVLEPGDPWARRGLALDRAASGKCSEARTEIEAAERQAPDVIQMLFAIALIDRFCGEPERAREMMERLKKHPRANDDGMWIAMTHAPFGERDSAFVWLEHQVWTTAELTDLRANRWLDSVRVDPRYSQLLIRLGTRQP
jgi:serine/threonine-protein kinase